MRKVPFCKYECSVEAHSNVSDVLDGEELNQVVELENEFKEYIGAEYALATSHGTSSLHLAMLALDIKRGDKIVCSVNTHPNVPEVVRHFLEVEQLVTLRPVHRGQMRVDALPSGGVALIVGPLLELRVVEQRMRDFRFG